MPKIIWEGNQREWNIPHKGEPLHKGAEKLKTSENMFRDCIPWGIPGMLICFAAVFLKSFLCRDFLFAPAYFVPAFLIGFLVALPLHELVHSVCYPKDATVWAGLCLRKVAAYAVSFCPITRRRYILMSLAPSLLGIIPLVIFIICPADLKPVMTMCVVSAFMGLISPAPDYMDVAAVLRQTKKGDMVQAQNDGLYRFGAEDNA